MAMWSRFVNDLIASGAVILALVLTVGDAHSQGVFVYKSQYFHSDGLAKALLYEHLEADGLVTWVTVGGERMRFEKRQFHTWAELPATLPNRLVTPAEQAWLSAQLTSLQAISKFPRAAEIAKPTLEMLTEAGEKLRAGMVRDKGTWLKRAEFDAAMASEEAARMAAAAEEELQARMKADAEELKRKEALAAEAAAHKMEQARREALREARIAAIEADIADLEKKIQSAREENGRIGVQLANLVGSNED